MKSEPVDEKDGEEEVKSIDIMDVDDEKSKPRERAKVQRKPESALEMHGDDDREVGSLSPCKEEYGPEQIGSEQAARLRRPNDEGEHTEQNEEESVYSK